jgi:hypothetical protein
MMPYYDVKSVEFDHHFTPDLFLQRGGKSEQTTPSSNRANDWGANKKT